MNRMDGLLLLPSKVLYVQSKISLCSHLQARKHGKEVHLACEEEKFVEVPHLHANSISNMISCL